MTDRKIGLIIGVIVPLIIGVSIAGTIQTEVNNARSESDITATTSEAMEFIYNNIELFFIIFLSLACLGLVVSAFRDVGVLDTEDLEDEEEDLDDYEEEKEVVVKLLKPKKQSYEDYVKERLNVERAFKNA